MEARLSSSDVYPWMRYYPHQDQPLNGAVWEGKESKVRDLLQGNPSLANDSEEDTQVTALHRACAKKRTEIVKILIEQPLDINAKTSEGSTALHVAVKYGAQDIVKMLLQVQESDDSNQGTEATDLLLPENTSNECLKEINVNVKDKYDNTPLMIALEEKHEDITMLLLEHPNIDKYLDLLIVHENDNKGQRILHKAVQLETAKVLKYLTDKVSNINWYVKDSNGATPLHLATQSRKNLDIIKFLIEKMDPTLDERDNNGLSILHYAAQYSNQEILDHLLRHGENLDINIKDKYDRTPLHLAIANSNVEAVKFLLKQIEIHKFAVDKNGWNALHYAAKYNQEKGMVEDLMSSGLCREIDATDKYGVTPLHVALASANPTKEYVMEYYLNNRFRKSNIDIKDNDGWTCLHYAAGYGTKKILSRLFNKQKKVDINVKDNNGVTPLHIAFFCANIETIEFLLERFSETNEDTVDNDGWTTVHYAARSGTTEIMQWLLAKRPYFDRNAQDQHGRTPLHVACIHSNYKALKRLLRHKADAKKEDSYGLTALHYAAGYGTAKSLNLIKLKCNKINIEDNTRKTPLHYAAEHSNIETLQYLLEQPGIQINNPCRSGRTPLIIAAQQNFIEGVQLLLEKADGAKPSHLEIHECLKDCCIPGELHKAVIESNKAIVMELLNTDIDTTKVDKRGRNVLHRTCERGNGEIIRVLLASKNGPNMLEKQNIDGDTPLHVLYRHQKEKFIEFYDEGLFSVCSNQHINMRNSRNESILSLALNGTDEDLVHRLLKNMEIIATEEDVLQALNIDFKKLENPKKEGKVLYKCVEAHLPSSGDVATEVRSQRKEPSMDDFVKFEECYNFHGIENVSGKVTLFELHFSELMISIIENEDVKLLENMYKCNLFHRLQSPKLKEIEYVMSKLLPKCRYQVMKEIKTVGMICFLIRELKMDYFGKVKLAKSVWSRFNKLSEETKAKSLTYGLWQYTWNPKIKETERNVINTSFPLMCVILGKYKLIAPFFQYYNEDNVLERCTFILMVLSTLSEWREQRPLPAHEVKAVEKVRADIDERISFIVGCIANEYDNVSREYVTEVEHQLLGKETILRASIKSGAELLMFKRFCRGAISGLSREAIFGGYRTFNNLKDFSHSMLFYFIYLVLVTFANFAFVVRPCILKEHHNEKKEFLPYSKQKNINNNSPTDKFLSFCVEARDIHCIPVARIVVDSIFHFMFLILLSYIVQRELLYNFTKWEIIACVVYISYVAEEIKQICNSNCIAYFKDIWNWMDIMFCVLLASGFCIRTAKLSNKPCTNFTCSMKEVDDLHLARIFYVFGLIFGYSKLLRAFSFFYNLGPKLRMMQQMIMINLLPFTFIIFIFILAFSTAFSALTFPNAISNETMDYNSTELTWLSVEKGLSFAVFGLVGDYASLSFASIDEQSETHTENIRNHMPYVFLFVYVMLMNILLLNLLIALFSKTVAKIEKKNRQHWYLLKLNVVREYKFRSVLPPPLNILDMIFCTLRWCQRFQYVSPKNVAKRRRHVRKIFKFLLTKYLPNEQLNQNPDEAIIESQSAAGILKKIKTVMATSKEPDEKLKKIGNLIKSEKEENATENEERLPQDKHKWEFGAESIICRMEDKERRYDFITPNSVSVSRFDPGDSHQQRRTSTAQLKHPLQRFHTKNFI